MKRFAGGIVGSLFLALFGAATAAQAADFTFNVPVNLQNLHPTVTSTLVSCRVFKTRGDYTAASGIGGGLRQHTPVPLDSNGNYRGTITVTFDADAGKDPSEARYYECDLNINGGSVTSYTGTRGTPAIESKPGTARTVRVSGEIPR